MLHLGFMVIVGVAAGDKSLVAHFQELLLRRLFLQDTPQDFIELAADALLPLLLAEPSAFSPLGNSLVAAVMQPRAAVAVSSALTHLAAWLEAYSQQHVGVGGGIGRKPQQQFRQLLCETLASVRGLIKMR